MSAKRVSLVPGYERQGHVLKRTLDNVGWNLSSVLDKSGLDEQDQQRHLEARRRWRQQTMLRRDSWTRTAIESGEVIGRGGREKGDLVACELHPSR